MIGDLTLLGDPVDTAAPGTAYASTGLWPISVPEVAHQEQELKNASNGAIEGNGWWEGATANQEYITPSMGGSPNVSDPLGYTTGLSIRRLYVPFDGKTLVPPRTVPNPQVGPVGFSTTASKTADRVASQTMVLPTTQQIAQSFVKPDITAIIANGGY